MSDFSGELAVRDGAKFVVRHAGAGARGEHLGCIVLARGYLADREELRRRLGLDSADQPTDGALLAHAYRRWGSRMQGEVNGEYAAVIYDVGAATALLTHDALGLTPLFYELAGDRVRFATDLADLAAGHAAGDLDREYMADFLAFGFVAGERTPFVGIRRLLPGRSLEWSHGGVRELHTWELDDVSPLSYGSDREYEGHFRSLLQAGVRGSLDPSGPTWISLSGGLDSSTVACVASGLGEQELAAYSVLCSAWPDADERSWMRAVVDHSGLPWHTVDIESMLPFAELPRGGDLEPTVAVIEEARLGVQNELLSSRRAKVMMTGHAGDAVLCAARSFPFHLADPLFSAHPIEAVRSVAAWRRGTETGRSLSFWMLRGLVEPTIRHVRRQRLNGVNLSQPLAPWLRPDYVHEMNMPGRVQRQLAPRCRTPGRQALGEDLWLLSLATVGVPRSRMSYELRSPLLYRPLVEFMAAIPWEQKLGADCDRYLQRRALRGILPEAIRTRRDKGSGNPAMVEGLRRSPEWRSYLCDNPAVAEQGIVDADQWRLAVQQASVGRTHDDKLFLATVALEAWLRELPTVQAPARVPSERTDLSEVP
jgi:asparagine synthase (glutamine-hydrolysing)